MIALAPGMFPVGAPAMLQYHARAMRLIGVVPKVAADAEQAIAAVEERLSQPLPASLREWYSIDAACDLLTR